MRRERERRESEKRERERGKEDTEEEREEEERGMERGNAEERKRVMEGIIAEDLGREAEISEVRERMGTAGIIVKMGKRKDRM